MKGKTMNAVKEKPIEKNSELENLKKEIEKNPRTVNELIENNYWTRIHKFTFENKPDLITFLISKGAFVDMRDKDGMTPLHRACLYDNFEMVKYLLENSADPTVLDKMGFAPIFYTRNFEIVKFLQKKGGDVKNRKELTFIQMLESDKCRLNDELLAKMKGK